jgi:hypothetical protein
MLQCCIKAKQRLGLYALKAAKAKGDAADEKQAAEELAKAWRDDPGY